MMNVNDLPPENDAGPILMWVSGVLMTFIIIITALRIFVRMKNRIVGWDDATILVAAALAAISLGFQNRATQVREWKTQNLPNSAQLPDDQ
jgi:hypothetical protein